MFDWLFVILNGVWWSYLRRWYGGLFDSTPILQSRGLQTVVMVLSLMPVFLLWNTWYGVLLSLALALWVQFQHWSRAIGNILDAGRNHQQTADNYDRWYRYPLDWVYNTINKILESLHINYRLKLYQGYYDFWYTMLRFGCPMLLLAPISWWFVLVGVMAAPCYFLSWRLFETFPQMYEWPVWVGQPKNLAEILHGFVFGCGIMTIKLWIL